MADGFVVFFAHKVDGIRSSAPHCHRPWWLHLRRHCRVSSSALRKRYKSCFCLLTQPCLNISGSRVRRFLTTVHQDGQHDARSGPIAYFTKACDYCAATEENSLETAWATVGLSLICRSSGNLSSGPLRVN